MSSWSRRLLSSGTLRRDNGAWFRAACFGKQTSSSRACAEFTVMSMNNDQAPSRRRKVVCYKCRHCGSCHVGHSEAMR
jgi:hypothetical protein